ncbi:MAG: hypothetical protein N2314_08435 [Brevinematales bacterium]|nr:hypothetical protein [Brevinematales bacterium]
MGKFDSIEKFLGKEEHFSPQQIEAGLDTLDDIPSTLSEVHPEAMANVERLLQSEGAAGLGEGVSRKEESGRGDSSLGMGASISLSEELLKELSALDGPPPSLEELETRFSSLRDIASTIEEEPSPEESVSPFEEEIEEKEPFSPREELKLSLPEGEEDQSLADLLGQMKVEPESTPSSQGGIEDLFSSLGISDQVTEAPEVTLPLPEEEKRKPSLSSLEEAFSEDTSFGLEPSSAELEMPSLEGFEGGEETLSPEPAAEPYTFPSFDETPLGPSSEEIALEGFGEPEPFSSEMDQTLPPREGGGEWGESGVLLPEEEVSEPEAAVFEQTSSSREPKAWQAPSFDFESAEISSPGQVSEKSMGESSSQELLLDPEKAVKIRERINRIRKPEVRQRIREAIVRASLSEELLKELILKLLLNEPDTSLEDFDRRYLQNIRVEPRTPPSFATPTRRVIYTEEAVKAEQLNKQLGKVGGISLLLLLISVSISALMWVGVIQPWLAAREYEKGLAAIEKKDYVYAEKKFQRGKEIGGFNIKWHNIFAKKYTEMGQWELAREKYEAALQRKPLDRTTIMNYAEFNKQLYPPRYEEAIALYTRLYKRTPRDFTVVDALGQTYVEWAERTSDTVDRFEKFKKANDLYETYLMKKSKDIGAHFRLLDIAVRITNETLIDGRYQIIEKLNKRAINFPILTRLASYYIDKRRLSEARKVLEKLVPLIKIKIRESDGAYVLDESMAKFSNQKPVYDETLYQYGRLQTINMDFVRAIWALSNAVGLNPSNAKAYNLMGEIYYTTDESPQAKRLAISLFEIAQRISPTYYKPYVNLGHLYFYNDLAFKDEEAALFRSLGYYQVAYQLYQMGQVDKLSPDPKLFYNLSWLYYKYGNYEEALKVLTEIYTTDPLNPYYSYAIGNVYQKMGIGDLAEVNYLKAIDYFKDIARRIKYINPDSIRHREVFTQLARAYNNLGVVYFTAARQNPKMAQEYEAKALLYFYEAKNMANKVGLLYPEAEYNIKVVLNKGIRGRMARLDDTLVKRTSLQRILEELKNGMIDTL